MMMQEQLIEEIDVIASHFYEAHGYKGHITNFLNLIR